MKLIVDHGSPIPLYLQAEKELRKLIALPEYQQGKLLPNEVSIAKDLGISRNTLRQAINKLVFEGLLLRKKGVGTMVLKPVDSKVQNWKSFSQEMKAKGIEVKDFKLQFDRVKPSREVQRFFGLKNDEEVIRMRRLRGKKSGPFVFFVSYFHPRIRLTGKEDFSRGLYEILEKDFQVKANLSQEEITAILSDGELARQLHLEKGEAILKRKRFVYDQGRRPIELNEGFYRADSFIYTVESRR